MARPIVWNRWKNNSLSSITENQEVFEKYFLEPTTCVEDTPKQHNLFNLWCNRGYLDMNEITISFMRKNRKKEGKHKSSRWAKTGLANLNFFYDFAETKEIYFDSYEKKFLSLSLLSHREQISKEKGEIFDKIRNILLNMAMIRLSRITKDMGEWLISEEKLIQANLDLFEDWNLKAQSSGVSKLSEIIKGIESGENMYKLQLKEAYKYLPKDMKDPFYHIIYYMPLTLVIKILRIYLPFSIGDELIRKKVYDLNLKIRKQESYNQERLSSMEINIIKDICNQYMEYGNLTAMFS
jgi:hypothetical protein